MGVVNFGVLGGTFDPVHNGHIAIAQKARERLDLNYVIFLPAGNPWFKAGVPMTPSEQRFEMVRRAVEQCTYFRISRLEIDRPGPSYTIDTIVELKTQLGIENELFFIMGWDSLVQLPRWQRVSLLVKLCRLVAVPRPGYAPPDLDALEKEIPGISQSVTLLDLPQIDISASDIRSRVAHGLSITGLVPETVEEYIREQGLYRNSTGS